MHLGCTISQLWSFCYCYNRLWFCVQCMAQHKYYVSTVLIDDYLRVNGWTTTTYYFPFSVLPSCRLVSLLPFALLLSTLLWSPLSTLASYPLFCSLHLADICVVRQCQHNHVKWTILYWIVSEKWRSREIAKHLFWGLQANTLVNSFWTR